MTRINPGALLIACMLLAGVAGRAGADEAGGARYRACDNKTGIGFFWVDTMTGETWWAEPARIQWVSYGKPPGAKPGAIGTYLPYENKSGTGMYVLHMMTGEGWWTSGTEWKAMGRPTSTGKRRDKTDPSP